MRLVSSGHLWGVARVTVSLRWVWYTHVVTGSSREVWGIWSNYKQKSSFLQIENRNEFSWQLNKLEFKNNHINSKLWEKKNWQWKHRTCGNNIIKKKKKVSYLTLITKHMFSVYIAKIKILSWIYDHPKLRNECASSECCTFCICY